MDQVFCVDCYWFFEKNYEYCLQKPDRNYAGDYLCDSPRIKNADMNCKGFESDHQERKGFFWFLESEISKESDYDCYVYSKVKLKKKEK